MPALSDLVERGLVTEEFGPFGGWGITDRGRARDDEWLASEVDAVGAREVVRDCYEAFLPLNTELLAACSAWQMRTVGDAAVPRRWYGGTVVDTSLSRVIGSSPPGTSRVTRLRGA